MFIVGAGDVADKFGRVKITYVGLILNVIGSLLIIITPLPAFLIIGRIIQGLSAACIMPSTLAIINEYYIGTRRQRALSYWSIGSWGGSGICTLFGLNGYIYRLAFNICCFNSINFISNVLNQTCT